MSEEKRRLSSGRERAALVFADALELLTERVIDEFEESGFEVLNKNDVMFIIPYEALINTIDRVNRKPVTEILKVKHGNFVYHIEMAGFFDSYNIYARGLNYDNVYDSSNNLGSSKEPATVKNKLVKLEKEWEKILTKEPHRLNEIPKVFLKQLNNKVAGASDAGILDSFSEFRKRRTGK